MNEQEQNIALCEWAGWREIELDIKYNRLVGFNQDSTVKSCIPDTNSLDVLHEMEKKLRNGGHFGDPMWFNSYLDSLKEEHGDYAIVATAPQRREALLRTIGKWKE